MKTIKITVLFVAALFATASMAVDINNMNGDGNELKGLSDAVTRIQQGASLGENDLPAAFMFFGYVRGLVGLKTHPILCLSNEQITNSQYFGIVTKYLNDNPARLHLPASDLIIEAINQAFPCAK